MYRLLARLTMRQEVADDLMQELVVRLSQSGGFLRADDSFAYARRAAIHLAFDWRRQGRSRRKTEPLAEEPAIPAPDPLGKLIDHEELEEVLLAMERLSPLSRNCLVLHYLEQLSYLEVADQIGVTPHRVRAACHKGIRRIQRLIGGRLNERMDREVPDDGF